MSTEATKKPDYELTEEGEVVMNKKGKITTLAAFDRESGRLEFVDEKTSRYYREQITRAVMEDVDGVASGNKIKSYGIKGTAVDEVKENAPAKPKASGLLGDKTPEVVDWYFKYRPAEALIRYGVATDKQGEPIVAHCKRVEKRLGENPATGLVEMQEHITENEHGYVATRQTHRTFLKTEVVGAQTDGAEGDDE